MAPPIVHEVIRSPGDPLPASLSTSMSAWFGQDFARVRVHSGPRAAESAASVAARAYTVGQHVVLGRSAPDLHNAAGQRLLAHELTHVIQQPAAMPAGELPISSPGDAGEREASEVADSVSGEAAPRPGRQRPARLSRASTMVVARATPAPGQPPGNTPPATALSWDEMFNRLSHERGFMLSRPSEAANPTWDPSGVGKGVGPDRTLRGAEVLAVIQVLDREGRPVGGLGLGAHRLLPGGHAEEQALAGLSKQIPPGTDLHGGRMMVVVDQYPCGPGSANCGQQLRDFAGQRGLSLEIRVPLRENVQRPGQVVSPRTASRGAFRTDLAADPRTSVRLVPVAVVAGPQGQGPGGTGPGPGTGGAAAVVGKPSVGLGSGSAAAQPPTLAPQQRAQVVAKQSLIAELESETLEATRFAGRVRVYTAAFGAIMQILGALDQMDQAQRMLNEGTIFGDAQRRADALAGQGNEAVHDAESITGNISLLSATAIVGNALKAGDTGTLFDVGGKLSDISRSLADSAAPLQGLAADLDRRARATDVLVDFYGKLMYIPADPFAGTIPQANALVMHESLMKFSAACAQASRLFAQAAELLSYYSEFTGGLAYKANEGAWRGLARKLAEAPGSQQAADPRAPTAAGHEPPPGSQQFQPGPQGFPSVEEQQGTVCPNCHRPAGGGKSRSPLSSVGTGSGAGGQMTEEDLNTLRQWVQAPPTR